MRVIVIGAGEVGLNVARTLVAEGRDVQIVESSEKACVAAEAELDAQVIRGNGASPRVLRELDVANAELFVAVTEVDEVNVIAALAADRFAADQSRELTTVARVRDPDFFGRDQSFAKNVLGIDFVIDPDRATASDMAEAIALPGAVSAEYFGDGTLCLAEVIVHERSPLIGKKLAERDRPQPAYIVGVERGGQAKLARPDTVPQEGDHLLVVSPRHHIAQAVAGFAGGVHKVHHCVIFGGGKVGLHLARILDERGLRVTVVERDGDRAREIAEKLERAEVLHDEGVSEEVQRAAGLDEADVFVASAGDDRVNLLAALSAKRLGIDLCLSVVSRPEFVPLVDAVDVDATFSPRLITAEAILRFAHGRSLRGIHLLRTGFEAIELEAEPGAAIVGRAIGDTHGLLRGSRVGAILRDGEGHIASTGVTIEAGDRVLMLGVAGSLGDLERAFTVKA